MGMYLSRGNFNIWVIEIGTFFVLYKNAQFNDVQKERYSLGDNESM